MEGVVSVFVAKRMQDGRTQYVNRFVSEYLDKSLCWSSAMRYMAKEKAEREVYAELITYVTSPRLFK